MTDIVQRLREVMGKGTVTPPREAEAADEIERLRAEVEALRAALALAQESIVRFISDEGSTDRDFDIADTVDAAIDAAREGK